MSLDFSFSAEQQAWRAQVREFAVRELLPNSREWDQAGVLPREAIRRMGKAGVLGVVGSRELGGQGRDYVSLGIAIEEIAAADVSCALIAWQQATHSHFFPGWGEDTVRAVHAGECVLALATSEENAGSDLSAIEATAVPDGDHYVLNGRKVHVSTMPGADVLAVSARIPDGPTRANASASASTSASASASASTNASSGPGAKVFAGAAKGRMVMLRVPTNLAGVTCTVMEQMGARAHALGAIDFCNVRVPIGATLGDPGQGKAIMYARFNVSRCLSPLAALGAARAVLDETIRFARHRVAFGRPIAANQGVSFPLVEHAAKIEAGRLLAYRALVANDHGQDATTEAAMAKWFGISSAIEAIQDCLQVYGANGYLKDYAVEQRLRDVYSFLFTGGTLNIMKLILVRQLLGAEFAGLRV